MTTGADPIVEARMDPGKPRFISVFGKKGSGKSVLAKQFWDSWPFDCLTIDPAGDFNAGDDVIDLTDPLPGRLPPAFDEKRRRFRYRPDPGEPAYADNLDRAVGMAFWTPRDEPFLVQVDEIHELTGANRTGPNMRRVLHQHRHRRLTVVTCGPRPKDIDPLVLSQSDLVYVFEMPHPLDQERIAAVCGIDRQVLADAMASLPKYHYLRYDADPDPELAKQLGLEVDELKLLEFPPVPYTKPAKDPAA